MPIREIQLLLLCLPIACLAWSSPILSKIPESASPACRLRGGGAVGVKMGVEVNLAEYELE